MRSFPKTNILLLLMPFTIGCHTDIPEYKKTKKLEINEEHAIVDEGFDIDFKMGKSENDICNLSIILTLDSGSFIVSPYSKDGILGPTAMSFNDSGHIVLLDRLLENPVSVEEFDSLFSEIIVI